MAYGAYTEEKIEERIENFISTEIEWIPNNKY